MSSFGSLNTPRSVPPVPFSIAVMVLRSASTLANFPDMDVAMTLDMEMSVAYRITAGPVSPFTDSI